MDNRPERQQDRKITVMWESRAHGMTYDRTERQQIRKTTKQKDNRIMWASMTHGMIQDICCDRQLTQKPTELKDNKIEVAEKKMFSF